MGGELVARMAARAAPERRYLCCRSMVGRLPRWPAMPMGGSGPCGDVGMPNRLAVAAIPPRDRRPVARAGPRLAAVSLTRRHVIERVSRARPFGAREQPAVGLVRLEVVTGRPYRHGPDVPADVGPSALFPAPAGRERWGMRGSVQNALRLFTRAMRPLALRSAGRKDPTRRSSAMSGGDRAGRTRHLSSRSGMMTAS